MVESMSQSSIFTEAFVHKARESVERFTKAGCPHDSRVCRRAQSQCHDPLLPGLLLASEDVHKPYRPARKVGDPLVTADAYEGEACVLGPYLWSALETCAPVIWPTQDDGHLTAAESRFLEIYATPPAVAPIGLRKRNWKACVMPRVCQILYCIYRVETEDGKDSGGDVTGHC